MKKVFINAVVMVDTDDDGEALTRAQALLDCCEGNADTLLTDVSPEFAETTEEKFTDFRLLRLPVNPAEINHPHMKYVTEVEETAGESEVTRRR